MKKHTNKKTTIPRTGPCWDYPLARGSSTLTAPSLANTITGFVDVRGMGRPSVEDLTTTVRTLAKLLQ